MKLTEIDADHWSGRTLAVDGNDPARYYLVERRRRELLAIGDLELARRRFALRVGRDQERVVAAVVTAATRVVLPLPAAPLPAAAQ